MLALSLDLPFTIALSLSLALLFSALLRTQNGERLRFLCARCDWLMSLSFSTDFSERIYNMHNVLSYTYGMLYYCYKR